MAITSFGYEDDIDADDWASGVYRLGASRYGVVGAGDWRVTPAAGTRTCAIAPGTGWGPGIVDISSAVENLTFPSVPSGVRYDMVVMNRNWLAETDQSQFAIVPGGSTLTIPSGRATDEGGEDDQPLALVKVTAGSSSIQVAADLRVWASNSGAVALDPLVRNYLRDLGTMLNIGRSLWVRRPNASLTPEWVDLLNPTWVNIPHISTAKNGGGVYPFGYALVPGGALLRGVIQKKVGGWDSGDRIGTIPSGATPTGGATVRDIVPTATAGQGAKVRIAPSGAVYMDQIVTNGTPGAGASPSWVQFDGVFIPRG